MQVLIFRRKTVILTDIQYNRNRWVGHNSLALCCEAIVKHFWSKSHFLKQKKNISAPQSSNIVILIAQSTVLCTVVIQRDSRKREKVIFILTFYVNQDDAI